jgi:Uma2 family endonuclease
MHTVITERGPVTIPAWVVDWDSFIRWADSDEFPERGRIHFLNGGVWVDATMEELNTHNQVKAALYATLGAIVRHERLGLFLPEGMLVTNAEAEIGTEPDGMFVSFATLEAKRVWFTAGRRRGAQATRMVGTPDLAIEIVSPSSEDKDEEWLMSAYHNAGVPEYWLINARQDAPRFDIFKAGAKGYTAVRKQSGWSKSAVFRRSLRLTRETGPLGYSMYTLDVR